MFPPGGYEASKEEFSVAPGHGRRKPAMALGCREVPHERGSMARRCLVEGTGEGSCPGMGCMAVLSALLALCLETKNKITA